MTIRPETFRGSGQYVGSGTEIHRAVRGRLYNGFQAPVVFLQGSHSLADSMFFPRADGQERLAYLLADAGFMVISGDLSQTLTQGTYGNDTVRTRTGQLDAYVKAKLGGRAGKVNLIGTSGGATAAINYARANPAAVQSMLLICPVLDLRDFHDNRVDASITQAEIETAYGGLAAYNAAVDSHSPITDGNQVAIAGIPISILYSTSDPYIPVFTVLSYQTKMKAAGGSCIITSMGDVGHNDTGYPQSLNVSWILANSS